MSTENTFSSDEVQLVTFTVGDESFGLNIMHVQEVIRMPSVTRVPQAPAYVDGMTNLRGHILPVVDTRTKFGMEKAELNASSRVIVVDIGGRA
ncbi:MAG: chemotaxis protein CheW, partial [Syntrophomonas sp.]